MVSVQRTESWQEHLAQRAKTCTVLERAVHTSLVSLGRTALPGQWLKSWRVFVVIARDLYSHKNSMVPYDKLCFTSIVLHPMKTPCRVLDIRTSYLPNQGSTNDEILHFILSECWLPKDAGVGWHHSELPRMCQRAHPKFPSTLGAWKCFFVLGVSSTLPVASSHSVLEDNGDVCVCNLNGSPGTEGNCRILELKLSILLGFQRTMK